MGGVRGRAGHAAGAAGARAARTGARAGPAAPRGVLRDARAAAAAAALPVAARRGRVQVVSFILIQKKRHMPLLAVARYKKNPVRLYTYFKAKSALKKLIKINKITYLPHPKSLRTVKN